MSGTDDGLEIFIVVVILAVAKFNGPNFPLLGVESEIVVQTPPVVAQPFLNLEARGEFVVVAGFVRDSDFREEVGRSIGVVGLGEQPGQLKPRLYDDDRFVTFFQTDGRVKIGHCDVV